MGDRHEEELLAQGAMTVLSLSLDAGDVILNPYPLTGPVGLSLGLMAWLVGGGTLVQHTPFDYQPFVAPLSSSCLTKLIIEPRVLDQRAAADQPCHQPERQPHRPGQGIGIEDHVARVERERQHGHRPLGEKFFLVAVARREEELLAQGAMTVLSLSLDAGDVILNPYPLTGPVGLSLGLMAWLVGGGTLVQHTPFDYQPFVKQLLDSGATVTAMPPSILAELVKDGVLRQPSCRLRRLGAVWSMPELAASAPPPFYGATPLLFDVYPLGDLASLVLRRETRSGLTSLPIGHIDFEDDETTVFIETKLGRVRAGESDELLLRGPLVPRGKGRCKAMRRASSPPGFGPRLSPATAAACASSAMPSCCIMAASPSRRASSTSFIRASPAISMPPVSCCRIPSSASAFSRPSCRRRASRSRSRRCTAFSSSGRSRLTNSPTGCWW